MEQDGTPVVPGTDQGVVDSNEEVIAPTSGTEILHIAPDGGPTAPSPEPTTPPQNPNHPEESYESGYYNAE